MAQEPDPLALMGLFNGRFGPDWHNYADGNPLRYGDPTGLRIFARTDAEKQTLELLENNPTIGPAIRALNDSYDFDIFFDARDSGVIENGGTTSFTPGRRGGFLSCAGSSPSVAHIYYNVADARHALEYHFGLGVTLANLLAHELGHINYFQTKFEATGRVPSEEASDAMSVVWENATRGAGPYRPRHEP